MKITIDKRYDPSFNDLVCEITMYYKNHPGKMEQLVKTKGTPEHLANEYDRSPAYGRSHHMRQNNIDVIDF